MQSYTDWVAQAQRGTSGDMVWDILSDWEKDIKQARIQERKRIALLLDKAMDDSRYYSLAISRILLTLSEGELPV